MGKCSNPYELLKLNHEHRKFLNTLTTGNKIEALINKTLPTKTGPNVITTEFHPHSRDELTPIILILFHGIERGGIYPDSLETNIILRPKFDKKLI